MGNVLCIGYGKKINKKKKEKRKKEEVLITINYDKKEIKYNNEKNDFLCGFF